MVDHRGHLHQVEKKDVRDVGQVSMNCRSQPERGPMESGYKKGNQSPVEDQKRYESSGPKELGEASLKVVRFSLRIKNR